MNILVIFSLFFYSFSFRLIRKYIANKRVIHYSISIFARWIPICMFGHLTIASCKLLKVATFRIKMFFLFHQFFHRTFHNWFSTHYIWNDVKLILWHVSSINIKSEILISGMFVVLFFFLLFRLSNLSEYSMFFVKTTNEIGFAITNHKFISCF